MLLPCIRTRHFAPLAISAGASGSKQSVRRFFTYAESRGRQQERTSLVQRATPDDDFDVASSSSSSAAAWPACRSGHAASPFRKRGSCSAAAAVS